MNSPYDRSSSHEEQQLYDHLITCRKLESPEQLLERFRCLFIDAANYPEPNILQTLGKLADSRTAEEEFKYILNRCCRILINYWWFQAPFRWAIADLVYLLQGSTRGAAGHLHTQRLRRLVRQFLQTEEYQSLQRLALVVEEGEPMDGAERAKRREAQGFYQEDWSGKAGGGRSLRSLIHRYPYLYPYCLGGHGGETEFETIRHLQAERQRKFDCELSRYMTYLIQRSDSAKRSTTLTTVKNPTLLSDAELRTTIKHFMGQVDGAGSYRDLAKRFLVYSSQVESYRMFKEGLYHYLIASIDAAKPDYGKHHFHSWLQLQLRNTLPQSDTQSVNGFLMTRTCHHLFEALVASPQNASNHFVFVDLINNVGATVTIGLLLKILLLYKNLQSSLERRFAVLYKHYENDGVEWLVDSLENLQIAFSIHFGSMDIPCVSRL